MEYLIHIFKKGETIMEKENQKLLEEVIESRLKIVLDSEAGSEEARVAFKEAMEAVDRDTELHKLETARIDQLEKRELEADKLNREEEFRKKEARIGWIVKGVELAATLVLIPVVETVCKKAFAKDICNFEKDYTFTTSAGKSLVGLFRFKK